MSDLPEPKSHPDRHQLADVERRLTRLLVQNIIPAWYPAAVDRMWGGSHTVGIREGRTDASSGKMLVTQARMTWFFARLSRFRDDGAAFLAAARSGCRFFTRRMRDRRHGGYVQWTSPSGLRTTDSRKHLYGQAFVLFALSEYAQAGDDQGAGFCNVGSP